MNETLLSCPLCGKRVAIIDNCRHLEECENFEACELSGYSLVVCSVKNGGCGASSGYFAKEEDAIAAWNRRSGGWIPVEERLPEKGECLVAHTDGTVHPASVIFGEDFKHCTHWMPLPQAPEGGGE